MFESFEQYLISNIQLTPDEIELICNLAINRKVKRHEILLSEGETSKHMIFIVKGLLRLFRRDEKGKEFILKFSNENRWLSDRESYKYNQPSKVNIEALENSELLLWKKTDFDNLMVHIPAFRRMMMDLGSKNQIAEQTRLYNAMAATAEEKYLLFSQNQAAILNRVPLHMVASYLGLSRETLSRIRKQALQK
jgi:CRP-like cAMP-binding protein